MYAQYRGGNDACSRGEQFGVQASVMGLSSLARCMLRVARWVLCCIICSVSDTASRAQVIMSVVIAVWAMLSASLIFLVLKIAGALPTPTALPSRPPPRIRATLTLKCA
jgi:hypothetical protein